MKGRNDAQQLQIELGISFYHGYTVAKCEGFADSLGISSAELTRRLGSLLAPTAEIRQPLGLPDSLQILRPEAGTRRQSMEPLALDDGSHGGPRGNRTLPSGAGEEDTAGKALTKGRQGSYWASLTPRQRTQKALDRYLAMKHRSPQQNKAVATLRAKLADKVVSARDANQSIYAARSLAKKRGLPIPPLPKETAATETPNERRKRIDRESHQRKRDAERKNAAQHSGGKSWSGMSLTERQAEMKRRMEVARQNKAKKTAPTYVNAGAHNEVRQAPEQAASA